MKHIKPKGYYILDIKNPYIITSLIDKYFQEPYDGYKSSCKIHAMEHKHTLFLFIDKSSSLILQSRKFINNTYKVLSLKDFCSLYEYYKKK